MEQLNCPRRQFPPIARRRSFTFPLRSLRRQIPAHELDHGHNASTLHVASSSKRRQRHWLFHRFGIGCSGGLMETLLTARLRLVPISLKIAENVLLGRREEVE